MLAMESMMTGKSLSSGLGVNFEERKLGTYVWVEFKHAVIDFQCKDKTLSQSERQGICTFLEQQDPNRYFTKVGRTVSAVEASILINDLMKAGFVLSSEDSDRR